MKKFFKALLIGVLSIISVFSFTGCSGKSIGVQTGTTGQFYVEGDADWGFAGIKGYKSKGYANGGLAVNDLKNGRVDYVIIDKGPALELEKAIDGIKVVDIELTEEYYAYGVDKNNAKLLADINEILDSVAFKGVTVNDEKIVPGIFDVICAKYATGVGITPVTSATFDASKADQQLVVATNAAFPPFEYKDGYKFAGIDMEIAKYLADELDMELVIMDMDFNAVVTSVGKNGVDIAMAGLTVTDERAEIVNFTNTYYKSAQVVITLESDTSFDACVTAEDVIAVLER